MNWIDIKKVFYDLSRMGVTLVKMPPDRFHELAILIDDNVDDGGSHQSYERLNNVYSTVIYGVKVEEINNEKERMVQKIQNSS